MAYFTALGGIIALAGVSVYRRFSQTPTKHLLEDLDTIVRFVDDAELIGQCRKYKSMLNNYCKRIAAIIFELEALHDCETEDFRIHAGTCQTSMQTHLIFIRNYAAELKDAEDELLAGLSAEKQEIIRLKTGKKGLANSLVAQIKAVTWDEILKGDIIAITILEVIFTNLNCSVKKSHFEDLHKTLQQRLDGLTEDRDNTVLAIRASVEALEQQLTEGCVTEAVLQDNLRAWIKLLSDHLGRIKF